MIVQEQVEAQTSWLSVKTIQLRSEMAGLKDKANILKQLLSTLIDICGLPRHPSGFDKDPPPPLSSFLASVHQTNCIHKIF